MYVCVCVRVCVCVCVCYNLHQSSSVTQLYLILCDPMYRSMPSFPFPSPAPRACSNIWPPSLMPSNYFILCCSLLLLPSIFLSNRVLPKELVLCIRWPKYWSFSFSICPFNEYTELISFRIDCYYMCIYTQTHFLNKKIREKVKQCIYSLSIETWTNI